MAKYIDIHAHTNFEVFSGDREDVITRALENNTWIINIGTQYDTSKKAVEMTNEYKEGIYATIGLHPIHTDKSYHDQDELGPVFAEATGGQGMNNASSKFTTGFVSKGEIFNKEKYKELAKEGKVVAIGECGLDYYHMNQESLEKQKTAFISQIELANELNLPLMLHVRNGRTSSPQAHSSLIEVDLSGQAYFDVYELIKKYSTTDKKIKGVSHFFAGSVEDMKRFIELGIYISFAGPITYKPNLKICDYESVIRETPLDMILTDTDSPYVAPAPHRGERNEPVYVKEIVKKIAEIKGIEESKMAEIIFENAKKLFNI